MSGELETIRQLYAYNAARRRAYLRSIWRLPEKERYRDRGGSFPSFVDLFLHVLDGYRYWFQRVYLGETDVPEFPVGQRLSEVEARRWDRTIHSVVQRVLDSLSEADLVRRLHVPKRRWRPSVRVVLLHMIEEELQHRGEMNALFWQMDVEPPVWGFWVER
jgi:uncharacterized damage-inducible protein DinB